MSGGADVEDLGIDTMESHLVQSHDKAGLVLVVRALLLGQHAVKESG